MKRRDFISTGASVSLAGMIPIILDKSGLKAVANPQLPSELTVVFQGDSITDAHRDRASYYPNNARGMGVGYVHMIVSELLGSYPDSVIFCYNRGISGHKVHQLADRWEYDCLQLNPDVLSLLIGVNDFWHTLDYGYDGTVEVYENDLRELLRSTREDLPEVRLIIGEPFAVRGGTAIGSAWSSFQDYRLVARKIADEFGAAFIPYHNIFRNALEKAPVEYWCPDGVHPSLAGAFLMKEAWLATFRKMYGD